MSGEPSTFRLYLLRAVYLLNFVGLGSLVWPAILNHQGPWDPLHGVAFSFWGALSLLMGLGIRYPLQMLPMLFIQLVYKVIWLIAVALPLWSAGQPSEMTKDFLIPVVIDLIVIPWSYVFANYVKKRGDRWRSTPAPALSTSQS